MLPPSKNVIKFFLASITVVFVYVLFQKFSPINNLRSNSDQQSKISASKQTSYQIAQIVLKQKNSSGIRGTANLSEKNGKVIVDIQTSGDKDATLSAHFRKGICKAGLMKEFKFALKPIINGKSTTILDITMENFIKEFPLLIMVHKGPPYVKVACGDTE
ncbi:MAG TPA: hypothetical protein VM077_05840 [Candidatus Limnocylindrales bacterium]|nr:hypothetical protein [Candidatus Limnocylindrales bacterium]